MKTLLAIEWLKIKRYRTFWILAGFFLLLVPLWNYEIANGMFRMGSDNINIIGSAYSFPNVWGNVAYIASYMIWFLCILVIILTANEYTFRTNRQNVINGWRRLDFLHAKVLMVFNLSVLATLYVFLTGLILGLANGGTNDMFSDMAPLFRFFLLSVNYLGFSLLLTILIKRSGLAISLFLLYAMIIENILKFSLNRISETLGTFLPLQASDEMLSFSIVKMMQGITGYSPATASNTTYIIVTIVWCAIYYFAARTKLLRSDW